MSYTLKLTNGKLLLTLPDQQSDKVTTSLTLIGKNVNAYGTDINQNYIHILENFANSTAPRSPLVGQLWYDTNAQTLKVYTKNNSFKSVGAPIISSEQPITLGVGEFWYDTTAEQMKFKVDSDTLITVGPQFDAKIGKSGWVTETIYDTSNNSQTVVSLYSNNSLMGILTEQTLNVRSDYLTATSNLSLLEPGFNAVDSFAYETKWHGTAVNAEKLGGLTPEQFIKDAPGLPIVLQYASSVDIKTLFTVGSGQEFRINVLDDGVQLKSWSNTKNLKIESNAIVPGITTRPAIVVDNNTNRVGFFTNTPQDDVDVNGNIRVVGNLTVLGTSTFVDSQDLRVLNKDIWLGWDGSTTDPYATTSTDAQINGGGIYLLSSQGFGPKEIRFMTSASVVGVSRIDDSWSVTGNMDLRFIDSAYYIYDKKVIDYTSLGDNIVNAPGLTNIGSLASLNVGTLSITSSSNTTTIGAAPSFPNTTIEIGNAGTKEVSFLNTPKVLAPYPDDELDNQVATVKFVEDSLTSSRNKTVSLSIDVTGKANSKDDPNLDLFVQQMLTFLWDPADPDPNYRAPDTARARVICIRYRTIQIDNVPSNYMAPGVPLFVDKDGIQSSVATMPWSEYYRVTTTLPASDLTIQRVVKEYEVYGGAWRPKGGFGGLNNIVSSTSTIHTSSDWYWDNP